MKRKVSMDLSKFKYYKKYREPILALCDTFLLIISYILAGFIKNDFDFTIFTQNNIEKILVAGIITILIYTFIFLIFKIYKSLWKYTSINEVMRLTIASVMATFINLGFAHFYLKSVSFISVVILGGIFALMLMFSFRLYYRYILRYRSQKRDNMKRVVIIGAGDAGHLLLNEIHLNLSLSYKIVGFVDDKRKNVTVGGYSILGSTKDLKKIKEKYDIEGALIAIKSIRQDDLRRIYDACIDAELSTKIMNLNLKNNPTSSDVLGEIKIEDVLGRGEIHLDQSEISSYITDKVICVTGAGGSIGSELCRQIVKFQPRKLIMIDISENYLYMLEQEFRRNIAHNKMSQNIEFKTLIASIRDEEAINDIFTHYQVEVVYHAAAHKHVPLMETRPMEAVKNNVFGTHNVIKQCIAHKVKRFIMISTDKAVNPTNVMGATKRMTELMLQAYGHNGVTKMAAVRFGNVLGSNGSVIPIFKEQIKEGGPVTITDKNIIRYFMSIPEAAQLVLQAGYYANQGDIFVLDMGEPVKIIELAEKMIRLAGFTPYKDINIIEIGLRPGEKMFEELRLDGEDTTKTKNNLIFKNAPMDVSKEKILKNLDILHDVIYKEPVSVQEIRETILSMIKE